jgi:virginiamycin B lyase
VLDPVTGAFREYRNSATQGEPVGIAVDRSGVVWFSTLDGRLGRLDPAVGSLTSVSLGTGGAGYGVAVDAAGRVWVGQLGSLIARYDPTSRTVTTIPMPTSEAGPWWPAVDASGNVWVVESTLAANRLARIPP